MTLKSFVEICGWAAAALILGSYSLLSFGKIQARTPLYQWMNITGALGFIINCTANGAWPSVALNVVWLGIAVYALRRNSRLKAPSLEPGTPRRGGRIGVPRFEFSDDLRQRQVFDPEQQQHVVEQVRGLADDFPIGLRDAGQSQLQAFLADLLGDAPRALREHLGGVAARRPVCDALRDDLLRDAPRTQFVAPPVAERFRPST